METVNSKTFRFADFELDGPRRQLRKQGQPVALNPKTFDLLIALVERHGEVVGKDELLDRVWAGQFVEEGNLTVQISTLRKLFGESKDDHRFVVTVPGRGYSFVADVSENGDRDLIIERHSLSRIVIDEDIKDEPHSNGLEAAAFARPLSYSRTRNSVMLVLAGLLLIPVAGYLFVRWNAAPPSDDGSKQLEIKRLTTNGRVSFAALAPDGKLFVYALKELEQNSLWLGSVEGGDDKVLRPSETGRYNDLAFSADGNSIFFTLSGAESRESVLYRMPTLGGPKEKIRSNVTSFAISPDGGRYAFSRFDSEAKTHQLVVANINSDSNDAVISLPTIKSFGTESISWSPDGGTIAFGGSNGDQLHDDVFVVNIADNSPQQVTRHGWKEIIKTAWVDDGKALLLVAQEKNSNTSVSYSQVWHVALPKGETRQLTHDLSSYRSVLNPSGDVFLTVELRQTNNIWVAPANDLDKLRQVTFGTFGRYDGLWGLDWTADGRIVFTSTDHQSQIISAMNADGSDVRQLTPPGYNDSMVNASNDGRHVVFESTRSGGSDIWRMDADGSNVVRITSDGKSYQPFISPDSKSVYYRSLADARGHMRRVSIEGGESEQVTDANVSYPSLSPDGRYVAAAAGNRLMVMSSGGGQPEKTFELTRFGTPSTNTRWSPDGKAIAYRDRGYGYWLQPVDGGEPKRMEGLPMEKFYNFAWSKDGKQFAFIRGQEIRDVVLFRRAK